MAYNTQGLFFNWASQGPKPIRSIEFINFNGPAHLHTHYSSSLYKQEMKDNLSHHSQSGSAITSPSTLDLSDSAFKQSLCSDLRCRAIGIRKYMYGERNVVTKRRSRRCADYCWPVMRGSSQRDSWVAVTMAVTRAVAGVTPATIYLPFPTLCFSGALVGA